MRTKYLLAALFLVGVGCEDNHSGQPSDPPGPARIMRVMVQDAIPQGARGVAMDLLDVPGSALSTSVACDNLNPCTPQFNMQRVVPDFSCKAGLCNDPLRAGAAPITPPEKHLVGEYGGTMIRVVFNKLLASGIEKIPNLVELDDWTGAPVPGVFYWDPTGALATADPILSPYGPAIVFKPNAVLAPHVTYTLKLAAGLTDRQGNAVVDQGGNAIAGAYTKTITTEDLTMIAATTTTDVTTTGAVTLAPDEILQLGFNSGIDPTTVSCTATNGGASVPVLAFSEAGLSCAGNIDRTVVDFVATDGAGNVVDWPAGTYSIRCGGKDGFTGASSFTVAGSFAVSGAATAGDPHSRTRHVVCN